ncbi:hypothetical protein B0T24DRAFT_673503 [Lasiosphaeria ovina]|uniref:Suppressor of anucleate metulae protein B n=1 Tax=Lasiosphaeria ovina TaxID=92902 RepID=A0AAE0TYX0_9PEZI|nr:hypothetical protein B0T24DRAFT_673503 [Lasiosphaeria ovina]
MATSPFPPPPGTRVDGSAGVGRGRRLLATRQFGPGEVIGTFRNPLLALPVERGMRTTCNYCLRVAGDPAVTQLRACTGCKFVVYCSVACQRASWAAVHKHECKVFTRMASRTGKDWLPTPVRAVMQVMLLLKAGNAAAAASFGDGGSLEGNVDAFKRDAEVWNDLKLQSMAAVVYGGILESEEMLERAERVICKIQTNAFNWLDADTGRAGVFLDPALAMVNHSCVPNAFIGFNGRTATLRAQQGIEPGDEIEISYIDYTLPRATRQEELRLYHFQCQCSRCSYELNVYQVCAASPAIPLNTFSLQPDLQKLRHPPIEGGGSSAEIDTIYKAWKAAAIPEYQDPIQLAQARWKLCKPLADAKMWAVEPLPSTLLQLANSYQEDPKALALSCFLATECEPYKLVAPFMPWRIKGAMMIAKLLSGTAQLTASGELAQACSHKGLIEILSKSDQVSMCEAILRLVVHYALLGESEDWEVLAEARAMLEDVESLEGRQNQSALLRAWAKDPQDPEGGAFFHSVVLRPVNELAALAIEIVNAELGNGKSLVRR